MSVIVVLGAPPQPADNTKLREVVGQEFFFTPLEIGARMLSVDALIKTAHEFSTFSFEPVYC